MNDLTALQRRVSYWVIKCFGMAMLEDKQERGLRLAEEAIELAQAVDVPRERLLKLVNVVYDKPKGDPVQELGGCLTTLCAMSSSLGENLYSAGDEEVTRIESLSTDYFQKRNAQKAKDGVGNYGGNDQ